MARARASRSQSAARSRQTTHSPTILILDNFWQHDFQMDTSWLLPNLVPMRSMLSQLSKFQIGSRSFAMADAAAASSEVAEAQPQQPALRLLRHSLTHALVCSMDPPTSHLGPRLHDGELAVRIDDPLNVLRRPQRLLHCGARLYHRGQQLLPEALVLEDPVAHPM